MDSKSQEEPLFQRSAGQDDSFYDTIDKSPEYDNQLNADGSALTPEEQQRQRDAWNAELAKLEEEIQTLRAVLTTKQREAADIKRKLGITPITEMRADLKTGITNIKESETYQKTNQAFKNIGAWSSKKLGDVRNSNTFKSFEEKMGGAYTSMKGLVSPTKTDAPSQVELEETKMTGSHSEQSFDEALRAAGAENGGAASPGQADPQSKPPPPL